MFTANSIFWVGVIVISLLSLPATGKLLRIRKMEFVEAKKCYYVRAIDKRGFCVAASIALSGISVASVNYRQQWPQSDADCF